MRTILLAMPDPHVRESLAALLRQEVEGVVLEAEHPRAAQILIKQEHICLLITDLFLPEKKGLELVRAVLQGNPNSASIVCIPSSAFEASAEALQSGVFATIKAPYDPKEMVIFAARGLQHHELLVHRAQEGRKIRKADGCHGIIGSSPPMQRLFEVMGKVAEEDSGTVLIQGKTGTGKELVARAIHAQGSRRKKNFVPLNCAAIPDDLLESELFGYVKGAFTGANASKIGRIQYADGGTLFLDEIGDMKPALQAKLLRVLQEKEFEPLGGVKPVSVDVRIIAATHHNLEKAVSDGSFREDLYYRLSVLPLHIPPLHERRDDIPLLIEKFVMAFNRKRPNPFLGFEPTALSALLDYPWPGNVRELENLVQRMSILHAGAKASVQDLPKKYRLKLETTAPPRSEKPAVATAIRSQNLLDTDGIDLLQKGCRIDFNSLIDEFENRLILQALAVSSGNKKEAALLLGLNRTTLLEKIKKKKLHLGS